MKYGKQIKDGACCVSSISTYSSKHEYLEKLNVTGLKSNTSKPREAWKRIEKDEMSRIAL